MRYSNSRYLALLTTLIENCWFGRFQIEDIYLLNKITFSYEYNQTYFGVWQPSINVLVS